MNNVIQYSVGEPEFRNLARERESAGLSQKVRVPRTERSGRDLSILIL